MRESLSSVMPQRTRKLMEGGAGAGGRRAVAAGLGGRHIVVDGAGGGEGRTMGLGGWRARGIWEGRRASAACVAMVCAVWVWDGLGACGSPAEGWLEWNVALSGAAR